MTEVSSWLKESMAQRLRGRDFLTLKDFHPDEVTWLLDFALALKRAGINGARGLLHGQVLALLFEKPSTRTRISFEVAMWQLGGVGLYLNMHDMQMSRGETIEDTGRVLSRYVQGIAVRTFGQERLEALAGAADVPVINGLSDQYHPCQAMADLLTLKEHYGDLRGRHLVYVGDGNNMASSLAIAGAKVGMRVTICTPVGYEPHGEALTAAREAAVLTGGEVEIAHEPRQAVRNADALYTDVWTSMGKEEEAAERRAAFEPYRIDGTLLSLAPSHAIVLHCLPAHRGEEITSDVLDSPRAVVWDQAENRLHVQKAILAALLAR